MDKTWWAEYRRAFAIFAAATGWLIASVASGYALAKIEHVPPASAVTPAPSGTGQLGRAPVVPPVAPRPTRTVPSPDGAIYEPPPPRRPQKLSPTPSPSASPPTGTPSPETSAPPTAEPPETVTPTP